MGKAKSDDKKASGKGGKAKAKDEAKGDSKGDGKVKGAQSINVRHILVGLPTGNMTAE